MLYLKRIPRATFKVVSKLDSIKYETAETRLWSCDVLFTHAKLYPRLFVFRSIILQPDLLLREFPLCRVKVERKVGRRKLFPRSMSKTIVRRVADDESLSFSTRKHWRVGFPWSRDSCRRLVTHREAFRGSRRLPTSRVSTVIYGSSYNKLLAIFYVTTRADRRLDYP